MRATDGQRVIKIFKGQHYKQGRYRSRYQKDNIKDEWVNKEEKQRRTEKGRVVQDSRLLLGVVLLLAVGDWYFYLAVFVSTQQQTPKQLTASEGGWLIWTLDMKWVSEHKNRYCRVSHLLFTLILSLQLLLFYSFSFQTFLLLLNYSQWPCLVHLLFVYKYSTKPFAAKQICNYWFFVVAPRCYWKGSYLM